MKKIILLLVIMLIPTTLAISTDMKSIYQPGETLIAEIGGNILEPITIEQIELKRGHVQVPFDHDVKRIGKKYYLSAQLPQTENNYTLFINDITTTVDGQIQLVDFTQNFSTQGELIQYSVKPGFISTKEDFTITVFLNRDFDETISTNFPEEREITLNPGENTLSFSISSSNPGITTLSLGIYTLQLQIIKPIQELTTQDILPEFRFTPRRIQSIVLTDDESTYPIIIKNTGDQPISDINLEYNQDIFIIEPSSIPSLIPEEEAELNLALKNRDSAIYEIIKARSGELEAELTVNISFTQNEEETETPYLDNPSSEIQQYYCTDVGGKICLAGEVCDSDTLNTIDSANCCTGQCSTPEQENNFAWIGWLLGIGIIIILAIIINKYRKSKNQKNPLDKRLNKIENKNSIHSSQKKPSPSQENSSS